jgi:uncharacterized surface anchored protein
MQRRVNLSIALMILMAVLVPLVHAQDAGTTGSVCVLAYEDSNENGVRDSGEVPLPGISVNLAVETDIIVQNFITTQENRPFCFDELTPGDYTLYFDDSPNHHPTRQTKTDPFVVQANQRIRVEFGAVSESPLLQPGSPEAIEQANNAGGQLETTSRLLIAALGAVVVMVFMFGFGVVIASIIY